MRNGKILAVCANAGISTRGNAVKALMGRLDKRFAQLGLELHNVRGRGHLLDHERAR